MKRDFNSPSFALLKSFVHSMNTFLIRSITTWMSSLRLLLPMSWKQKSVPCPPSLRRNARRKLVRLIVPNFSPKSTSLFQISNYNGKNIRRPQGWSSGTLKLWTKSNSKTGIEAGFVTEIINDIFCQFFTLN